MPVRSTLPETAPGFVPPATAADASAAAQEEALLRSLEEWRTWLAEGIARHQADLALPDPNRAIAWTLLRLLFLRCCEERGLEPRHRLLALAEDETPAMRLQQLLLTMARRYESALLHTGDDAGTTGEMACLNLRLQPIGEPLRLLLRALYPPAAPCDFARLSPAVLCRAYEQLLAGERGLRRAEGIYYTPAPIVDYILEQSVGALLASSPPAPAAPTLRVLDPCCGAGSFLTRLYSLLLTWYRARYLAAGPERFPQALRRQHDGSWRLTLAERLRILQEHVYGVDLDRQALAVARLALILLLCEECEAWERKAASGLLQRLSLNLRHGNALGGSGDGQHPPFDWQAAFPRIVGDGGFEAVVGNPPYLFGEQQRCEEKAYLQATFHLARSQYDACWLFIEQGLKLTRPGGRLAFVVPDALLARDEARRARAVLLREGLLRLYHCGPVFRACVSAVVVVVERGAQPPAIACDLPAPGQASRVQTHHLCDRTRFLRDPRHRLLIHLCDDEAALLERIEQESIPLGRLVRISRGEETGKKHLASDGALPILAGEDLRRYYIAPPTRFVQSLAKPALCYQAPKILVVKTGRHCVAALETAGLATMQSLYNLQLLDPAIACEALLGLLNSRFVDCYLYKTFTAYKRLFPQLNQTTLAAIPVPVGLRLPEQQAPLIERVRAIMELQTRLARSSSPQERQALRRESAALDEEIDALIYRLYGLSEADIRALERAV
jgi:SAM-dependent methyltransferase